MIIYIIFIQKYDALQKRYVHIAQAIKLIIAFTLVMLNSAFSCIFIA